MKRFISIMLAALTAVGFSSCSLFGNGKGGSKETEPNVDPVITDTSVGEMHFAVSGQTSADKTAVYAADGSLKESTLS